MTTLRENIEKVGVTLTNNLPTSSGIMSTSNGTSKDSKPTNKKLEQLESHVFNSEDSKQHMTTDFGHKVSDPDHWLRVTSKDSIGGTLLEDQVAREKVVLNMPGLREAY
jgi:hypothetical protein